MVIGEVKNESIEAAISERAEDTSAQELGSIRSAYLARVAAAESSDFGAHETAWESGAVRGAYLKHLAETAEVAVVGGSGSEGNVLRAILAAHATVIAPPSGRRRLRKKARARKR